MAKKMIVMPANSSHAHTLEMVFPARLGLIMSPSGKRDPKNLPWIGDNELFAAWAKSGFSSDPQDILDRWDAAAFLDMLVWTAGLLNRPRAIVVPDMPGNAEETLRMFRLWYPRMAETGLPLAIAVQDGMTPDDVPDGLRCFVGGSTEWKWKNVELFCRHCDYVHVGRVNQYEKLWRCDEAGADSVDGSGFFRGDQRQQRGLINYLKESSGYTDRQVQQSFCELEVV